MSTIIGKLFGKNAKQEAPKVPDAHQAIQDLNMQCQNVEKRIKVLEQRQKDLKMQAVQKKKAGETRAALVAMKQMKMQEKELAKLDGQQMLLE